MNPDQTTQELTENQPPAEEPERPVRSVQPRWKPIQFEVKSKDAREKPAVINTEWKPPLIEPPEPIKDTAAILLKRQELARLELELKIADDERRVLVRKLEEIEHQISSLTRQLTVVASNVARVESKELPEHFFRLFKKSLYGELGPMDLAVFCRIGLTLSNKKFLLSVLKAEAEDLDDALAILEKQAGEVREKLGDAESEAA